MAFIGIDIDRATALSERLDGELTRIRERGAPFPTLTEIVESVGVTERERYFVAWVLGQYDEANKETKKNDEYHK